MLAKFYFLMTSELIKEGIPIVTSLPSFLVPYTGSSGTVALPALGAEIGLDAFMLGWITAAYINFQLRSSFSRLAGSRILSVANASFCRASQLLSLFISWGGLICPSCTARSL